MIWVFGDSFSSPFKSFWGESTIHNYIKYKGYRPKTYVDLLSEQLHEQVTNLHRIGSDNSLIFLRFMENYHLIKEDDIVIFGWSAIERFKFVDKDQQWNTSLAGDPEIMSKNVFEELMIHRAHNLYVDEQLSMVSFIENILKTQKVFQWTWSNFYPHQLDYNIFFENTITFETKGKIKDLHYGEIGHKKLYEFMSEGFKTRNQIQLNIDRWLK